MAAITGIPCLVAIPVQFLIMSLPGILLHVFISLLFLCPNFFFLARTLGFGLVSSLSNVTSSWCDDFCEDAKYRLHAAITKCHRIGGLFTLCSRVWKSKIVAPEEVMPGYLDATVL